MRTRRCCLEIKAAFCYYGRTMCGIAGVIGNREVVTDGKLKTLAPALAHRGPDDEGIEVVPVGDARDKVVGLVHRRLSIIDLSPSGHQPMKDEATGNWITYNGEIYNYRELRRELEAQGHRFRSQSDTEVILKSYTQYRVECVKHLRGMFAFALFEARAQKLFLAVDRFGIKPLYTYHADGVFAFASEIKALLGAGIVPREIDPEGVASFLSFGAVQAPTTIIKGVEAILPAQYQVYEVESGKVEKGFYWSPRPHSDDRPFTAVIEDTVRHHLVSDVPVALFLSGGVDSSALAILVNRVADRALDSFSVTFEEKEYAEGRYARLMGEKFCARHHELKVNDADLEQSLPAALDAQDQPTIDGVNAYVISKAVHDAGIKVVLSGQGGDEVFGGYPTFRRIPKMVQWWKLVRFMPKWKRKILARMIGEGSVARSKLAQYLVSDGRVETFYEIARQLFNGEDIRRLGLRLTGGRASRHDELANADLFSQVSLLELRGYLANMLLRDGDVMSMAHGLEVRVPYLDHLLVEHVMSIEARMKVAYGIPKPLLLNTVREEMPREIWARKKMGFTFPWEVWLRGRLRSQVEETLHDVRAAEVMGLNLNECQEPWRQFLDHQGGVTWSRVWALYVLIQWARARIFL